MLLVFALIVGPAAAAQRLTTRFWHGIALAVLLTLDGAWPALMLAYLADWPTSFLEHHAERHRLSAGGPGRQLASAAVGSYWFRDRGLNA